MTQTVQIRGIIIATERITDSRCLKKCKQKKEIKMSKLTCERSIKPFKKTAAILNLSDMADTQELQTLALVANLIDRSLSMPDTDDCVADQCRLNWYRVVYILTK